MISRRDVVRGAGVTVAAVAVWPKVAFAVDRVDVTEFGASGDGAIDDSEAVARAVDEAIRTGGVLYFPGGTYLVSSAIEIDGAETIVIEGDGWESSAIVTDGECALLLGSASGIDRLEMSGLAVFSGSSADESTFLGERGVRIGAVGAVVVRDCAFGDVDGVVEVSIAGTAEVSFE